MSHKIPPKGAEFLSRLTPVPRRGRKRWRDLRAKLLYEWDELHGELEVYNEQGKHQGVVEPYGGTLIKGAVKGRKIDV